MKSLIVVFGAVLIIICLPVFFTSTHAARVQEDTDAFAGVTTAAGVYAANVTLPQDIYDDSVASITSVTSNVSSDSPSAYSYNSVSRVLQINGLDADTTRTLSVVSEVDSTYIPSGFSVFFGISGWFLMFAIMGLLGASIYGFFDT